VKSDTLPEPIYPFPLTTTSITPGISITKHVPAPTWLSTRICPPCACTNCRAIAYPSPLPPPAWCTREQLDESSFQAVWEKGKVMTLEQAIASAVSWVRGGKLEPSKPWKIECDGIPLNYRLNRKIKHLSA